MAGRRLTNDELVIQLTSINDTPVPVSMVGRPREKIMDGTAGVSCWEG